MEKQLALYVSASAAMDAECELLGQMLAGLIRSVKWVIKRTPGPHEPGIPDIRALRSSQFYLILLGTDITAPVGVELMAARSSNLAILAYRNLSMLSTPALSVFVHKSDLDWQSYYTLQAFILHLEKTLVTQLVQGAVGYGLELADLEELAARRQALEQGEQTSDEEKRRGAGRGGVILARD